ncbi:hypothetical protein [Actinomyces oris]|uniref:hypothetical protein n=1 Tax=Actinomyces oris TaxID=544580 RepID=UPI00080719A9|nr:hypothetical protein [Actinomyces oris]OBY95742.1 hypothetical protein BBG13_05565 [Actinomyces oris]
MLFDLTASDTSPLSLSEENVAALAACGRGTILLDVAARADATLIAFTGTNGRITLSLRAGRLDGEQVLGAVGRPEGPPEPGVRAAFSTVSSTPRTPWAWTTAAPTPSPSPSTRPAPTSTPTATSASPRR